VVQAISSTISVRGYARSSSFKMALLFTVLLGIAVSILGYFSYYFNQTSFIQGTEAVIDTEIRYLASHKTPDFNYGASRVYLLLDAKNNKISGNLDNLPAKVLVLSEGIVLFDAGSPVKKYAAKITTLKDGKKLLIGVDITQAYQDSLVMKRLSFVSIGLMIAVIVFSFLISNFVVSRTGNIARIAHNIMRTGNLSQRIEQDSSWDDLGYMAQVLNGLLTKIEELMGNIRQVSDNIAHDLRTPLTRLRNRLETLQQEVRRRADKDLLEMCDTLTDEADHILNTFAALLRIAEIEAGRLKQNFSDIHLDKILGDVVDLYEPLSEEKNIRLELKTDIVPFYGDRDMLFQAFANLLDNAIKFTPQGGCITMQLTSDKVFTMTDSGPGIPDLDKEKVFQRFYRTETSRHTPGNGLGLSLVSAVIAAHEGCISLTDARPGLCINIRL
jgi:signal transduction histidine kinase